MSRNVRPMLRIPDDARKHVQQLGPVELNAAEIERLTASLRNLAEIDDATHEIGAMIAVIKQRLQALLGITP